LGACADRLLEIATRRLAAVEDARLVEMDMRLDEAGADQAAAEIDAPAVGREILFHRRDRAFGDADVGRRGLIDQPRVFQNEVHRKLRAMFRYGSLANSCSPR